MQPPNWVRHCLTEKNNEVWDLGRVLAAISVLAGILLSAVSVLRGDAWDPQSYGIGIASVFAAVGVYIQLKREEK